MTKESLGGNVAAVMYGALVPGVLVHVETDHYAIFESPASIKIVKNINDATHIVKSSYYDVKNDNTVFDFERIKR
jgi:hypothetical protein